MPRELWEDLLYCLGPDGVGWGEYFVPDPKKEDNFIEALRRIRTAVEASPS